MDDKTFIATYVAQETQRINGALKEMVGRSIPPSEAEKDAIIADIERTLARLQSAISHIQTCADDVAPNREFTDLMELEEND